MENFIDKVISLIFAAFAFVIGNFTYPVKLVIAMLLIDFFTGIIAHFSSLSSKKARDGVKKKLAILSLIALSNMIGVYLNIPLRDTVIAFYIFEECLSIIENIRECGVKIPKSFTDVVGKNRKDGD